ncbi:hypothetical protein OG204_15805 [Streptomyces sp. NBC_01387]|uniref:hypothetical protein n=1 Tax=unclassified Streptomyces TaxID=2593676 RepID=UPI002252FADB|nr:MULTISPECIES: hypothetical protein [unclassified Streptomyces]MCX4550161.1 hypothetical protein [Streptomyces sp. NBC_01500]WSC21661.1 hypothetical protein OIE60_19355 [Streptomyces sp. NBC_01766]WSV55619.1 hypothetical protein OG282_19030 [Streptomyces sp. NBC_01014]
MTWAWEYDPSEEYLVGGVDPAVVARIGERADELVRAAEALYLDGTTYQGDNPKGATAYITGGMFEYLVVVRHNRLYVRQITIF